MENFKESEDEDSYSGLNSIIQLDKEKDQAEIVDMVWQNSNAFEKFRAKIKTYNKPQDFSDLLVIKCNKEIWKKRMNAQHRKKDLKVKNF